MIQVGITGNIGSGKTTATYLFTMLGVPVYNADIESKLLLEKDKNIIKKVKKLLGKDVYLPDCKPDRKHIASIVFKDKLKLKKLENILHPAVNNHYRKWAETQNSSYILKEAALLLESNSYKELDLLIVVAAPEALRINRATMRDLASSAQVVDRMRNQMSELDKIAKADYIIKNDNICALIPQVVELHQLLLKLAHAR